MRTYIRPRWPLFAAAIAAALVKSFAPLVVIWVVAQLVDVLGRVARGDLAAADARDVIVGHTLIGLVAFVVSVVPTYWRDALPGRAVSTALRDIRVDLYARMHAMSHSFHDRHHSGALAARISNDVAAIDPFLRQGCVQVPMATVVLLSVLGYFVALNPVLAVVSVALLPVQGVVVGSVARRSKRETRELLDLTSAVFGRAQERLAAVTVVKSFTQEEREVDAFVADCAPVVEREIALARLAGIGQVVSQSLQMLSPLAFVFVGGLLATAPHSTVTIGVLVQFVLMQSRILEPLVWILDMQRILAAGQAGATRVFEVLDRAPEIVDPVGIDRRRPAPAGDIVFDRVGFTYPGGTSAVFSELSLTVPHRATVAVVGPSGAGKSTLVALLCRFYDVQTGRVTIGGRDVRDVPLSTLRGGIGLVPQDPVLFAGTIHDNIAYGVPDADRASVEAAARRAHADEFIGRLDHTYDEVVGERGTTLSGGQRQRIAIARAFLIDPEVIVMDEATSALDTTSERLVSAAMTELMAGRTTVLVAHRLSTVRHADLVVVLDDGRAVQQGRHADLVRVPGLYAELYRGVATLPSGPATTVPAVRDVRPVRVSS